MKKSNYILIFFIFYCICFCYSFFLSPVYNDEIWNYGVAYNIANVLIPYRDFNLVTTPLYPFLASIFIKLFGHYLYSFHLFNSFILSSILFILYYKLGKKSILLIPFILLNCYPGYNILSILLLLLVLCLCEKEFKYQDNILGFLIGFIFLTKQTIGICLVIPMLFYGKNKMKVFLSFLIPILCFCLYLVYYHAFFDFLNYCFLGLFDFGDSNSIYLFLPIVVIICFILIYKLIKSNFKDKKLFYILMFQIITVPICDDYHFMLGLIPILYYWLFAKNILNYQIKYYFIISLFICCSWFFYVHDYDFGHLYSDQDSYLYGRNISVFVEKTITEISDYVDDVRSDFDYIYFFSANAYYIKLNINYPLTKYDMICNGNMGYQGSIRYIDEIDDFCNNNSCMFILYRYEFENNLISQTNKELVNYVKENYDMFENVSAFEIYIN